MQRVAILGCSGAGKSTFARALGARIGAPVVHLDALFWEPGWVEPVNAAFRARVSAAIAGEAWVCEGNYVSRTYDLKLPRADTVIFLHQPRWLCIWRILTRWLFAFGRGRPDMAEGCRENFSWELLTFDWNFQRKSQPRILAEAAKYPAPITVLSGGREMARFLAEAR